ncbi:MAG: hypothetical protein ACOX06_03655 [Candidatus Dojkabacteria bacterium]
MAQPKGQKEEEEKSKAKKLRGRRITYVILWLISLLVFLFFKYEGIDPFNPLNRFLVLICFVAGLIFVLSPVGFIFHRD